MILDLETALVNRLAAALPMLHVQAYPEQPAAYTLKHPRGAVLVGYGRSAFGDSEASGLIVQARQMEFDITVVSRDLRSHGGAYGYLDAARIALTGWRPEGAGKVVPVRDRFLGVHGGIWRYVLTVSLAAMTMETAEPEQSALLQQIAFAERLSMEDGT